MGTALMAIGMFLCMGSFIAGVLNMTGGFANLNEFDSTFRRHGYAMIGMAIGMCTCLIGLVLFASQYLSALSL